MKPASFAYHAPRRLDEAIENIGLDDAKALAGGQSLMPILAMRLGGFAHLVDLAKVAGLRGSELVNDHLIIGAMTTQASIGRDPVIARLAPLLAAATPLIGHFQIRNRGTIGGSIAHADPAAEYPAVALALDAEVIINGPRGTRQVPSAEFFRSSLVTDVAADELVTAVRVPLDPARTGYSINEVARRLGDFAVAGVACAVTLDEQAKVTRARIGMFGVAPTPIRAASIEDALVNIGADDELTEVSRLPVEAMDPATDVHASARYRRHLAGVLVERSIAAAMRSALARPDGEAGDGSHDV